MSDVVDTKGEEPENADVADAPSEHAGHPPSWPERNVGLIVKAVVALALAAVAWEVTYGQVAHKHVHFAAEAWPGFYAIVGFASYVFLVLSAKQLRRIVSRPPTYYDDPMPLLAFDPSAETESPHAHQADGHDGHADPAHNSHDGPDEHDEDSSGGDS